LFFKNWSLEDHFPSSCYVITFSFFAEVPWHLTWIVRDRVKQLSFLINLSIKQPSTLTWAFPEFNLVVGVDSEELSKFTENSSSMYLIWVRWEIEDPFSWMDWISDDNDFQSFLRVGSLIYTISDGKELSFYTDDVYCMM